MPTRVRFRFTFEVSADPKTSILKVKQIQIANTEETYLFPPELQPLSLHPELQGLQIVKSVTKSLTKRNQFRNVNITLPDEVAKLYFDTEENVCFKEHYLEEYFSDDDVSSLGSSSNTTRGASNAAQTNADHRPKPLQSIVKDMVIDKFTGKNQSVVPWLTIFERECRRLEIGVGKYSEALRLFLEGPAAEWFSLSLKVMSINDPWDAWKQSMIDSFGDRGWSDVSYAFSFRYVNGTLNEYVIKKLNLLLDVEPTMSVKSRIFLVALGLPSFVRDRLSRKKLETQNELISEINQLESLVKPKNMKPTNTGTPDVTKYHDFRGSRYKPCSICDTAGFPGRFHPTATCWNNQKNKIPGQNKTEKTGNKNIKLANNAELENELNSNENNQKN